MSVALSAVVHITLQGSVHIHINLDYVFYKHAINKHREKIPEKI